MMNKNKFKIISGVVLIFILGGLAGGLGGHLFFQYRLKQFVKGPEAFFMPKFMRHVEQNLDLTSEQQEKIKKIVYDLKEKLGDFRQAHDPELREIVESHIERMKKELNPEQQKKLDRLIRHIQKRIQRRFKPHKGKRPGFEDKKQGFSLIRLKNKLNLSEDQVAKLRPLIEARRQQEQEMKKALDQILTQEQLEKYRRLKRKSYF